MYYTKNRGFEKDGFEVEIFLLLATDTPLNRKGTSFTDSGDLVKNSKSEALSTPHDLGSKDTLRCKQIQNSNYQMVKINGGLRSGEERKIKG
jgi:hypothetical protein